MTAITTATAIALATTAASAATGVIGARRQASAQKRQAAASRAQAAATRQAEEARRRQANLISQRERRKALRNAIIARSNTLSNLTGRGIGLGSSGAQGALGAIQSELGQQTSDIAQNQQITNQIFDANEQAVQAREASSQAVAQGRSGQVFSNISGQLIRNLPTITRVGSFAAGKTTGLFSGSVQRDAAGRILGGI